MLQLSAFLGTVPGYSHRGLLAVCILQYTKRQCRGHKERGELQQKQDKQHYDMRCECQNGPDCRKH